jgi:hypothetical protein
MRDANYDFVDGPTDEDLKDPKKAILALQLADSHGTPDEWRRLLKRIADLHSRDK